MRAYLCGPIDRVYISEARTWRERLAKQLLKLGIDSINPLNKYGEDLRKVRANLKSWHKKRQYEMMREFGRKYIVDPDVKAVQTCDMLIMYLPSKVEVCGSYAELGIAYEHNKLIYVVSPRHKLPKWLVICSTKIFNSFLDLIDYLEGKYGK